MPFVDVVFGGSEVKTPETPAARLHEAARLLLFAMLATAVWGVAVGAAHLGNALGNVYRVPVVILLSTLATLPAGLLLWRAFGVTGELGDLVLAHARGTFHGALVLAAFAPLLAIYAFTTAPGIVSVLAVLSALAALATATLSFLRGLARAVRSENALRALPVALVCLGIQLAALPQLIAVMSPILPAPTSLAGGVEGLFGGAR